MKKRKVFITLSKKKQIEIDIKTLNTSELRTQLRKLTKTANSRIKSLERKHIEQSSKAYQYVSGIQKRDIGIVKKTTDKKTEKEGIKFNTDFRKMSKRELEKELRLVRDFLNAKTSTITGTTSAYRKAYETFQKETKSDFTYDDWSNFWYNSTVKEFMNMYGRNGSDLVSDIVSTYSDTLTPSQIIDVFEKEINRLKKRKKIPDHGTRQLWKDLEKARKKADAEANKKMKESMQAQQDAFVDDMF